MTREASDILARGGLSFGTNTFTDNLYAVALKDIVHMHVLGASRKGKSNFLEHLIRQIILLPTTAHYGMTFLDPHGSTFDALVSWIAAHPIVRKRRPKVRLISISDPTVAFSFNPFRAARHYERTALVALLVNAVLQVWQGGDGLETPRLRTVLTELFYALAANNLTLLEANDFLRAEDPHGLRRHFVENLPCEVSRAFWEDLEGISATRRDERVESTASRLRLFLKSPVLARVFGQHDRTIDLAEEMDDAAITLINLKPGPHLSAEAARLIGTLLVTDFYTACFRRKNPKRRHFLVLDECQRFLSPDIARILDESAKFGLSLVLSHQHLGHLRDAGGAIFDSVTTNPNVRVVFGGLNPDDAEYLSRIIFRGTFDLQKPKAKLYRLQAAGNDRVLLGSTSTTRSESDSRASSRSETTAETESISRTESEAESESWAATESTASASARHEARSEGSGGVATYGSPLLGMISPTALIADGLTNTAQAGTTEGLTQSEAASSAFTEAGAKIFGTARSEGRAETRASTVGESTAHTSGTAETHGVREAFITRYEHLPTAVYDLAELIHLRSVSLAQLPVGQAYVRVGTQRPRRLAMPYLKEEFVLPERIERARSALLAGTPYLASAEAVDAELAIRRRLLIAEAQPRRREPVVEPEHDEEAVVWR
jgi:hypothetical protein